MVSPTIYERAAWEDRFNRPTIGALRAALSPDAAKLFNQLRRQLLAVDGVTEGFNWQGVCWRWTIEYYTDSARRRGRMTHVLEQAVEVERAMGRVWSLQIDAVQDGDDTS